MTQCGHGARRARWLCLTSTLAVTALVLGACNSQPSDAQLMAVKANDLPKNEKLFAYAVMAGEGVYRQNCASCHGADLKGDRARGAANLTDDDWLYGGGLMNDLERTIGYGIRSGDPKAWNLADMPAYASANPHSVDADEKLPHLEAQEIFDLVQFLLRREGRLHDAAASDRGSKLFHGKAICFDCHTDSARGDPSTGVPNLADNIWLYGSGTESDIAESIGAGRKGVCPAWLTKLGPAKVREVAAYVKAHSKQSPFAIRPEDLTPKLPHEIPPPATPGEEEPPA